MTSSGLFNMAIPRHHLLYFICLFLLSSLFPASAAAAILHQEDFSSRDTGSWSSFSVASDANWSYEERDNLDSMTMNGFGADAPSNDWLISPALDLSAVTAPVLTFQSRVFYEGGDFKTKVSLDYSGTGTPQAANWITLDFNKPADGSGRWTPSKDVDLSSYAGADNTYLAFQYTSTGTGPGDAAAWNVGDIQVTGDVSGTLPLQVSFSSSKTEVLAGEAITFTAEAINGEGVPYSYSWDFGDGNSETGAEVTHRYQTAGTYSVTVTATDAEGDQASQTQSDMLTILQPTQDPIPEPQGDLRVAAFNAYLNRAEAGALLADMEAGDNAQAQNVAEILQRIRPDVVLLNEFDYVAGGAAVDAFKKNYLAVGQNGAEPIDYPHVFLAPSNTGIDSGLDLNQDGETGTPDDAYGFGMFPGQYGMVLLSRYPIVQEEVRTFQTFLWRDMPDAMLPINPETGASWYSVEAIAKFRLSSKSHWDVPVKLGDQVVHMLASHPTPPVFDGEEDRNGTRNHDEIRFWADYVDPEKSSYIYDDNGKTGGLGADKRFVIMGDLNASPDEGDATGDPMTLLLQNNAFVHGSFDPGSKGSLEHSPENPHAFSHTADWRMRADYVLPSIFGIDLQQGAVFWPPRTDALYRLVGPGVQSSDHRLVWLDLALRGTAQDDAGADNDNDEDGGGGSAHLSLLALLLGLFGWRWLARRR